jgi:PBSX family phage terminase large subunit
MSDAALSGLPMDQTRRFVAAGYVALHWALGFHAAARECDSSDGPVMVGCGGARGPGKSYAIMAQVGLDDCQREPGLKALYLRKVQKSASESFDDLVRKVFAYTPHSHTQGRVVFENGSRILIGGYYNENDIDKYTGIEYDVIALEEGTQISGEKRIKMRGSLRTSKPGWRTRWYESANPGGIGHGDFKQTYVMPYRESREIETRFLPATYRDNPFLSAEYIDYLESLSGALGTSWREGDWDSFEGQVFSAFSRDRHVCKAFEIPKHWQQFGGLDWGYSNPFAFHRLAKDPDTGRVYVTAELYERELTDRQQARLVRKYLPLRTIYADPSMWTKKNMEDKTFSSADEYRAEGVILTQADNSRLIGKRKIATMLEDLDDGQPGLMIFENCPNLIRTLPALPHDPVNVEDVDTDAEDHAYDALRYGLTAVNPRPARKAPPPPKPVDRLLLLDRDYRAKQNALSSKDL